jgi:tetratricopeptide (TPR) repeat protein
MHIDQLGKRCLRPANRRSTATPVNSARNRARGVTLSLAALVAMALAALPLLVGSFTVNAASPDTGPAAKPVPTIAVTVEIVGPAETPVMQARPTTQRQQEPGDNAQLVAAADELTFKSAFADAEAKYGAAVRANPRDSLPNARWARLLLFDLRPEEALGKAMLATQIDPGNAEAYAYLARARDWLGKSEEALAAAQQAVTLDPNYADGYALLAEVYLDMNHPDKALVQAQKALELNPDGAEGHRSMAYALAAKSDLPGAIAQAEKAAQAEPGLWLRYDDLANMLRQIGDYPQATKFYQWAIDIHPKTVSYAGMALCQIQLGAFSEAAAAGQSAVKLDPDNAAGYGVQALAYAKLNQCEQAKPAIQQSLSLDASQAEAKQAQELCAGGAPATASTEPPAVAVILATPTSEPPAAPIAAQPTPMPPVAPPAPRRIAGRMAYPVFDAKRKTYDIYLANADGSNRQLLIEDASSPSLSQDGKQIAYRSWNPGQRGLFARDLSGTNMRVLTEQIYLEDRLPKWAPTGNLITFSSLREADRRVRTYLASPGGKNDWVIRRGAEAAFGDTPNWMPDGRIVFNSCVVNNCGLVVMNNDGSGSQLISTDPSDTAPSVAPDGSRIAFMSRRDGNWEIYTISPQGGEVKRLTADGANDGLPVWSPDGQSIAFGSDRNSRWAIWVMSSDGSNQRELFALEGPLNGHVRDEQDFSSRGWTDESISWIP